MKKRKVGAIDGRMQILIQDVVQSTMEVVWRNSCRYNYKKVSQGQCGINARTAEVLKYSLTAN